MRPGYHDAVERPSDPRRIEAHWSFLAEHPGDYRVLPDGRLDLLIRFRLGDGGHVSEPTLIVAGPAERYFTTPVEKGAAFFGARFRAGWGPTCLGLDGPAIRNAVLVGQAAEGALDGAAGPLLSQITLAGLEAAFAALVDRQVRTGVAHIGRSRVIAAVDALHLSGGRIAMADLARQLDVPERSLRRDMGQMAGLPVKTLATILRFQRTLRLLHRDGLALAEAAHEGGYVDQSHMTRDFLRLGGFTPGKRPEMTLVTLDRLAD